MEKRRDLFHGRRQKSVENSVKFEKERGEPAAPLTSEEPTTHIQTEAGNRSSLHDMVL